MDALGELALSLLEITLGFFLLQVTSLVNFRELVLEVYHNLRRTADL